MFITIAAHIAAMAPGTTIGAAHPVELGGGEVSPVMAQKLENFAVSFAQTVAAQRGRNVKWVEDAVRHSASIGENEAHSQHVVDFVASDLNDLLAKASGHEVSVNGKKRILELKGAAIRQRAMTWRQKLLDLVADPNLVYLLLMGGIVGLYFEFAHPGVFLPGVAGAICLVLALVSFEVLPISTAGFLLLLFGVSLLIAEGFVPTHGVFGIGGVIALVLGSLFLIDKSQTDVTISRSLIAGVGIGFSVVILGIGILVARTRGRPVTTGKEGLIGEIGEVRDPIGPGAPGRVLVHGENWRATSDTTIATGSRAQVVAVRGAKLVVRPV